VFGAVPILLILIISLFRQILPHWVFPGYIALMIPLGQWLSDFYGGKKFRRLISWAAVVCILMIEAAAVLHTRFGVFHLENVAEKDWISGEDAQLDITLDAFGWDQVGPYIAVHYPDQNLFLFTHLWFLSGEIDLAVEGNYPVMCYGDDARGFGLWDAKLDMRGEDGVFICTNRYPLDPRKKYAEYFGAISDPDSIVVFRGSRPAKTFYFYYCECLIERYPLERGQSKSGGKSPPNPEAGHVSIKKVRQASNPPDFNL
jgi:hypothetical protein